MLERWDRFVKVRGWWGIVGMAGDGVYSRRWDFLVIFSKRLLRQCIFNSERTPENVEEDYGEEEVEEKKRMIYYEIGLQRRRYGEWDSDSVSRRVKQKDIVKGYCFHAGPCLNAIIP